MAAVLEAGARAWIEYEKPAFGIGSMAGANRQDPTQRLPVVEEVVFDGPFQQLRRFRVADGTPGTGRTVVLVVAPMSGHHATLLRDTVRELVRNHTVYISMQDVWAGDVRAAQRHRDFYDEYNAVADLHAPYYLQTVRSVFQDFDLPRGQMYIHGEQVDPSALRTTALLTIEGLRDDIAEQGQTAAALTLCSGVPLRKKEHLLADAGHYGLFSGSRWREQVCPAIGRFIATHGVTGNGQKRAARKQANKKPAKGRAS